METSRGKEQPSLWVLDADERFAIKAMVQEMLDAPTREERSRLGNRLQLFRRKNFATDVYARFYFAYRVLQGSYESAAVMEGMAALDHIFLGQDIYEPAGIFMEQLLALEDASADPSMPEGLKRMFQGYFHFLFSHHLSKGKIEEWIVAHPQDKAFGPYLSAVRSTPPDKLDDRIQSELLHLMAALVRDPENSQTQDKIRKILQNPVYQNSIIPLLVQFNNKAAETPKPVGLAKMTESRLRPVTRIMFEPAVSFDVLLNYFVNAKGIYGVWHKQYDYDSDVMRWFLGDLWGEIDRRLGSGEVSEREFLSGLFDDLWTVESLIALMGAEPVTIASFPNVHHILLKAMTGSDLVLSSRVFDFISRLQEKKAKARASSARQRRIDGDDTLIKEAFTQLFQREGISALPFQIAYSLTPGFGHIRILFTQAAVDYIANLPPPRRSAALSAFAERAEMLSALLGNSDLSGLQRDIMTVLKDAKKAEFGRMETPSDSFSSRLRDFVHKQVDAMFESPNLWVQKYLAEELKRLNVNSSNSVYVEFEESLAIMQQLLFMQGRSIEQIETANMSLFQAGLHSRMHDLKEGALQQLEVEFFDARAGRSEDDLRAAAFVFYYYSILRGYSTEGRKAEFPMQSQYAEDLNLLKGAIKTLRENTKKRDELQSAGDLYQRIIRHYGFKNLNAMKTLLHYVRVAHNEDWTETFLKALETSLREAYKKGDRVDPVEINDWLIAELANHSWPKRRILRILQADGRGQTRIHRLIDELDEQAGFPAAVAKPASVPPAIPPVPPVKANTKTQHPIAQVPPVPGTPVSSATPPSPSTAPNVTPPAVIKPAAPPVTVVNPKIGEMTAFLKEFDGIMQKTPDHFKEIARAKLERSSAANDFARAVGFLLISQEVGDGNAASIIKRYRAFELVQRTFDSFLKQLEYFESPEIFAQVWAKIPSDHPAAWFREESFSPERMVEFDRLNFDLITNVSDYFDYLVYDRSLTHPQAISDSKAAARLERLLDDPVQRQAFGDKLQSDYFMRGVWQTPFLFNEAANFFSEKNNEFKNIRQTLMDIARQGDPRAIAALQSGLTLLHRTRRTNFVPEQPQNIKQSLREFHADLLVAANYFPYVEKQVDLAIKNDTAALDFVRSHFTGPQISVMAYGGVRSADARGQIISILAKVQAHHFSSVSEDAIPGVLKTLRRKRSEVRRVADAAFDALLLEQTPENSLLFALHAILHQSRVAELTREMKDSGRGDFKARLLERLLVPPAGFQSVRPAELPAAAQSKVTDAPLVWISSKLPELTALKTFVRENPNAHVLILLLPQPDKAMPSMRVRQFSTADFPQIKIAAPESREAFRRVLRNVSVQFNRTFSSEPVFVLNSEVENRPEFEDVSLIAEKVIAYNSTWQGSAFLPHHYLLLLDAAKLSQDLDLAYVNLQQTGKSSWYRVDERLIGRSLLSDLGQFLTTQLSFTTSA